MQVSIENVGKLGRKLTVRLPAQELEDKVRSRIQETGRSARLKGFRPGKVPTKVIEQRFGRQIRGEVLSEMIGSSYQEAITREKLRPAVQPAIQTTGTPTNGEIEYTATFEVMPEIGTIDISGLEIVKPTSSVTDADIDQMIETLRMQRRTFQPVDRAAQAGDMVLFEYAAEANGARHPATGFDRVGTLVGSGAFIAEVENALVGHKAGDDFTIEATFPPGFREPLSLAELSDERLAEFDAVFVPGGHGPMADLSGNPDVTRLLRVLHEKRAPIAALCHGPAALLSAPDREDGQWLFDGYRLTCFTDEEEDQTVPGRLGLPWYVDTALKNAGAVFDDAPQAWVSHVVVDRNLITGQNPNSTEATADTVLKALEIR